MFSLHQCKFFLERVRARLARVLNRDQFELPACHLRPVLPFLITALGAPTPSRIMISGPSTYNKRTVSLLNCKAQIRGPGTYDVPFQVVPASDVAGFPCAFDSPMPANSSAVINTIFFMVLFL